MLLYIISDINIFNYNEILLYRSGLLNLNLIDAYSLSTIIPSFPN